MLDIKFSAKRLDGDEIVEGYYFVTPLTAENSGLDNTFGWFFLSDGIQRHCISTIHGNVYVIDPSTIKAKIEEKKIGKYILVKGPSEETLLIFENDELAKDFSKEFLEPNI